MITKEKFEMVWRALKHAGIRDTKSIDACPLASVFYAGQYYGLIWFLPDATNIFGWNLYFYKINRNDNGELIKTYEDARGMHQLEFDWELYKLSFKRHYLEVLDNIDDVLNKYTQTCNAVKTLNVNYEDFMVYDYSIEYGEIDGLYEKYIMTPLVHKSGKPFMYMWIQSEENGEETPNGIVFGGDGVALYETVKSNEPESLANLVAHRDVMFRSYPYIAKDPEYNKHKVIGVPVHKTTLEEFNTKEELLDFLYRRVKELSNKYRYETEFFDDFVKQEAERLPLGVNVS